MTTPNELCLACDAARREAVELYVTTVEEAEGIIAERVHRLAAGMNGERAWRVSLFLAGIAAGLTDAFADRTGLSPVEIAHVHARGDF
jgi:hypothetical protein